MSYFLNNREKAGSHQRNCRMDQIDMTLQRRRNRVRECAGELHARLSMTEHRKIGLQ